MNDVERIRSASSDHVAALLGPGLPSGAVDKLAGMARLAPRLYAAAASRLGELPLLEPRQSTALALDAEGLREITLRAGAVWYAGALARVIDGAMRRGIIGSLGSTAYALALEGYSLSPSDGTTDLPQGDLVEAAIVDGECCWAAWRAVQPTPVATRLSLLGCAVTPQERHRNFGPAIVSWLLDRA